MKHSPEDEQLELYILGELPPDEAARIEATLNEDPDTQHKLQSAKRMVEALDQSLAEPKAPPDLAEQIIARLPSERPRTSATRRTRRRWSNRRKRIREADIIPITVERTRQMKRIARLAVAATILVALGILVFWMTIGGGSTNIAFANVADALERLRSATYDVTSEAKGEKGQPSATATGKGFFLAPSHQRIEIAIDIAEHTMSLAGQPGEHVTIPKYTIDQVTIADGQAEKSMMLTPNLKLAMAMDMKKMREDMKKSGKGAPPDLFEMVRRLVREGSSGTGEKAERLGKKEIDGREAVGFRTQSEMGDMILWADPKTAWPVRIEIDGEMLANVHMVMDNFRYDVDLDPSLFSLEPPEGYSTQAMEMTMPVEEDLLRTLRTIAEHGKGEFPAKLGMNKEVMVSLMAGVEPEIDKLTGDKMDAEMNKIMDKIAAKHGGKEKLKEKYGKDIPPAIMAEFMAEFRKASAPIMQEQVQKQAQEQMPIRQERMRGITFYMMLQPQNDPHYVGGGVKLGTPDCPILWYKPTGTDKYRVIYADLSVKELTPDDVNKWPEAKAE